MSSFGAGGFQQIPLVVKNLLIINVLVFALRYVLATKGIDLDAYLGLHYWQSPLFRWWQPVTHLFMHGSIEHIFFNMFALWMFGRILENVWGPKRFLIFYMVCGLGAALCHLGVLTLEYASFHSDFMAYQAHPTFAAFSDFAKHHNLSDDPGITTIKSFWSANADCGDCASASLSRIGNIYNAMINEATIGASGAVFGVLFGFGYLFPNTELYIMFIPIPVKAKWVVGVYALIELTSGLYNSAGDNIAHFAHLGGMLFAFILLRIWGKRVRNNFY